MVAFDSNWGEGGLKRHLSISWNGQHHHNQIHICQASFLLEDADLYVLLKILGENSGI